MNSLTIFISGLNNGLRKRGMLLVSLMIGLIALTETAVAKRIPIAPDTITAAKAFLLMPQQDLDLLTKSMRQDMLDYMEERDSIYKKANIYMGLSWIEAMNPDYMRVHLSDVSSLQIKRLPIKGKLPVIMTVYTINDGNGSADSTVKFFDNGMQELPTAKFLKLPNPKDFFSIPKGAPIKLSEIEEIIPFHTMDFTINPTDGALTGVLTSADALSREEADKLKPYLVKQLRWTWDGHRMQQER